MWVPIWGCFPAAGGTGWRMRGRRRQRGNIGAGSNGGRTPAGDQKQGPTQGVCASCSSLAHSESLQQRFLPQVNKCSQPRRAQLALPLQNPNSTEPSAWVFRELLVLIQLPASPQSLVSWEAAVDGCVCSPWSKRHLG